MRKIWNFMLLGIITMGLGMSVTSCKDDDNNNDNNKQSQEAVTDAATNFWAVVGQLVGIDQSTDDYADKSFEPTIGTPKDGNATIREVLTNDAATAAMRFCDLAGLEDGTVDENTATYTWQDDAVGTLTYTKTQDGSSLATVDVAIRQIPGLRQIVYLTAAQQGKNGDFPGTAWYRFGDVVSKFNADDRMEYWICVRPCFGPEYKGVSHWITVSPLPNKNIYTYDKASNKIKYQLPTNIGVNEEHMQNLAEMLYAITDPEKWQQNLTDNYAGGLKMFHDFKFSNIKYHNKFFWERVKKAWDDKEISATAFGLTLGEISALLGNRGLNFLAKGYSWPWGNSPTLYQYNYKQGTSPKELNTHKKTFTKVSKNVISNNITLNLEDYILYRPYWTCDDFFGDEDPRFIIRHATGKELMGSDVDVYQSMNGVNGIEDVYIYNGYYRVTPGRDT
ncbi:MAG: hypothetical protein K6D55_00185, partial [Prevotella sp.]|nr:hypothetical protein [Prevotella sp.]